jgi:hypothetical protein
MFSVVTMLMKIIKVNEVSTVAKGPHRLKRGTPEARSHRPFRTPGVNPFAAMGVVYKA